MDSAMSTTCVVGIELKIGLILLFSHFHKLYFTLQVSSRHIDILVIAIRLVFILHFRAAQLILGKVTKVFPITPNGYEIAA